MAFGIEREIYSNEKLFFSVSEFIFLRSLPILWFRVIEIVVGWNWNQPWSWRYAKNHSTTFISCLKRRRWRICIFCFFNLAHWKRQHVLFAYISDSATGMVGIRFKPRLRFSQKLEISSSRCLTKIYHFPDRNIFCMRSSAMEAGYLNDSHSEINFKCRHHNKNFRPDVKT